MQTTTNPKIRVERSKQALDMARKMAERYRDTNELLDQILPEPPTHRQDKKRKS